jgi:hypothetical protein
MLHACVQRFDVTENLEKFYKFLETKGLFRCKKFGKMDTVAFSLLFDN